MIKRFSQSLAVLLLAGLGIAGAGSSDAANAGDSLVPGGPGWQGSATGLPDLDRKSGQFLTVSGDKNFTLANSDPTVGALNVLSLAFEAGAGKRIQIAGFDAGTGGPPPPVQVPENRPIWDQQVDGLYVINQPDTIYTIYPDPLGLVAKAIVAKLPLPVGTVPVQTVSALSNLVAENDSWCALWDIDADPAAAPPLVQSALGSDGKFHFALKTELKAGPLGPLSGYEINGYKLAFNGTYSFPDGAIIGFIAGVVDGLEAQGSTSSVLITRDPLPAILGGDPQYTFDGTLTLAFSGCELVEIYEADADWNRALDEGDPGYDPAPSGNPPDSGIPYFSGQAPAGLRDATNFAIAGVMTSDPPSGIGVPRPGPVLAPSRPVPAVGYAVIRPNGTIFTTDEFNALDATTPESLVGHPSITASLQGGADAPFVKTVVPQAEMEANPGTWKFRWVGLDARNSIYMKFKNFGTTRPSGVNVKVLCSDQPRVGLPSLELKIVGLTGEDATKIFNATTDANGAAALDLKPGSYSVEVVTPICFSLLGQSPVQFTVETCAKKDVELVYLCRGDASGVVFCDSDVKPGVFDASDDFFDIDSVVVLERLEGAVVVETIEVPVAANVGTWAAPSLQAGAWRARVKSAPAIDLLTKTTTQPVLFTIDGTHCSIKDVNFGYVCETDLCGRLFCDKDGNCLYDPAIDEPLGGVTVKATLGPLVKTTLTSSLGEFCFKVRNGDWVITIDPAQPALKGTKPITAPPNPILVRGQRIQDLLYCYECFGRICGTVYLNKPNCNKVYEPATDVPLDNIQVNLWKAASPPPAAPFRTQLTAINGLYCFEDLEAGDYIVQVGAGQLALAKFFPTDPTVRLPSVARGDSVEKQDFGYCAKARVYGKVFRENGKNDCDGTYQADDTPIQGVTVQLVGTNPVRPAVVDVTDLNGDYDFPDLDLGTYEVRVNGGQPQLIVLAPGSALTVPVTLLAGDETRVDFPFCPGSICGTVYKNAPKDCDENYDFGVDTPLPGVVVNLWKAPNEPPALPFRTTLTGLDGGYCFLDLDGGTYRVQVGAGQPQLVNLVATAPVVRNPVLLPGGEVLHQDFGYCPLGRIHGRVFRESDQDKNCDGVFNGTDEGIQGVLVALDGTNPVRPPRVVLTDANGEYAFENLEPGVWRVQVDGSQPQLIVLAPGSAATVPATVLGGDDIEINFPFCPGRICGTVYKNAPKDCDEDYDLGVDTPLPGIVVNLWQAPNGPPAAPFRTTLTGLDGGYCFLDLDAGTYRVQVGAGQPQLVNLVATAPVVRNPVLLPGGEVLRQDFGYCVLGRIHGRVFRESDQDKNCDGVFNGTDEGIQGVLVALDGTNPVRPPRVVLTDANGEYAFENLEPGVWRVQVDGSQPQLIVLAPGSAATVPATVLGGDDIEINFPFCPGRICGTVYENPAEDCDEDYDFGVDTPLSGIAVNLWQAPNGPPAAPFRTTLTGLDGGYCFLDLDAGTYRVQVGAGQPQLVDLVATAPVVRNPVVLPGGQVLHQDFGYCEPLGLIHGYVYENPPCTCDATLDTGDTPKVGVRVLLSRQVEDMVFQTETFTDDRGHYEFLGLPAGSYRVEVDGDSPVLVDLTPATPGAVGPFLLPAGGEKRVDFGFCSQRLSGIVFREPPCGCDGRYNTGDLPVEGVLVVALALDGSQAGTKREALTDANGRYTFEPLPVGRYEVSIPAGQAVLGGLNASSDSVLTVTVVKGGCCLNVNFGWCPPGKQGVCAKVFCEPQGTCNGRFDAGRDQLMPWIEVFVAKYGADTYLRSGFTDANGRVCFDDLPVGKYVVYVDGDQDKLDNYKASTATCFTVCVTKCVEQEVCFGWCRDCKPTPCCEGDLHETLIGTSFWVGDCKDYKLDVRFLQGCGTSAKEVDSVTSAWRGTFGGALWGANDVLQVADVRVRNGVAYVVLRLRAQGTWFQDGRFGREAFSLKVTLNGTTFCGCANLRCESFRPSQYFQLSGKNLCVPACDCGWRWDGRSAWDAPWLRNPKKTSARFLVLDTQSYEAWQCLADSQALAAR